MAHVMVSELISCELDTFVIVEHGGRPLKFSTLELIEKST